MSDVSPDDLIHGLTMALCECRGMLRSLARRKAWEPSIDDCRRIAEEQVEQLKRAGVERIIRRVAPAHSMRAGAAAPAAPAAAMSWWGMPRSEA